MARTALAAPTRLTEDGIDPSAVDAAVDPTNGNSFAWTQNAVLWVVNTGANTLTVTIPTPATVGRGARAVGDASGTIAAGAYKLFGPFGSEFVQADGAVYVDYSGTAPAGNGVVLDAAKA